VELDDIGHVDIFGDAQLLTYLQTRELDLGLTSKEKNQIIWIWPNVLKNILSSYHVTM